MITPSFELYFSCRYLVGLPLQVTRVNRSTSQLMIPRSHSSAPSLYDLKVTEHVGESDTYFPRET